MIKKALRIAERHDPIIDPIIDPHGYVLGLANKHEAAKRQAEEIRQRRRYTVRKKRKGKGSEPS